MRLQKYFWLMMSLMLLLGCSKSTSISGEPDWQTFKSENLGISIEIPYPLTINEDQNSISTFPKITAVPFVSSVYSIRSEDKDKNYEIVSEKMLDAHIKALPEEINKKFESIPVTCSGIPATLTTGSFENPPSKINHFSTLLVVKGNQYWIVDTKSWDDLTKYDEIAKRVIQSVKIESKTP